MEYKVTGLVIKSNDYQDKDKLITLFTLEMGKITAKLKSVKNANAKLKFAGNIFCFGEFILTGEQDRFIAISCSPVDNFYDIVQDYDKFCMAGIILEIIDKIVQPKIINEKLFVSIIKFLNEICYGNHNKDKNVLIKCMYEILFTTGYTPNLDKCAECGLPLRHVIYLSPNEGRFVCEKNNNYPVDIELFRTLKTISETQYEQLDSVITSDLVSGRVIKLLRTIIEIDYGIKVVNVNKYLS